MQLGSTRLPATIFLVLYLYCIHLLYYLRSRPRGVSMSQICDNVYCNCYVFKCFYFSNCLERQSRIHSLWDFLFKILFKLYRRITVKKLHCIVMYIIPSIYRKLYNIRVEREYDSNNLSILVWRDLLANCFYLNWERRKFSQWS